MNRMLLIGRKNIFYITILLPIYKIVDIPFQFPLKFSIYA